MKRKTCLFCLFGEVFFNAGFHHGLRFSRIFYYGLIKDLNDFQARFQGRRCEFSISEMILSYLHSISSNLYASLVFVMLNFIYLVFFYTTSLNASLTESFATPLAVTLFICGFGLIDSVH